MRIDDRELVTRARAGDQSAFEALVEEYRDAVSGVCYSYLGNFDDVQDAAQEAFVQAYLHLDGLRDAMKFGPWLRMIASNVSKGMLRRRKPDLALEDVLEPESPREDTRHCATRIIVRDALAKLSEKNRLTVTLSCINGYSYDEVATFLEVPINTVRSRLRIAKAKLREEMITMVSDVLHKDKPDPELTKRVMDAITKLMNVRRHGSIPGLIRTYDEIMRVLDTLKSGATPEQAKSALMETINNASINSDEKALVLEMIATLQPEDVIPAVKARFLVDKARLPLDGKEEAHTLVKEAEALVGRVHQGPALAMLELSLASGYDVLGQREAVWLHYERSLDLARRFGNRRAEGMCLQLMAVEHFYRNETSQMVDLLKQSSAIFEKIGLHVWAAANQSLLMMYEDAGEERFRNTIFRMANCYSLKSENGIAFQDVDTIGWQPGFDWAHYDEVQACPFFWVSADLGGLGKFPYTTAPSGTSWSDEFLSYTEKPRVMTVTVISRDESVTTPAGTFNHCLLVEQAAAPVTEPDDAPDRGRKLNQLTAPTTLRWYAPGVGLVQLLSRSDEMESIAQLKDYTLTQPSEDYIPLAIGNTWTYVWTGTPEDCVGKEFYHVAAKEGNVWYLEHYAYIYREHDS